MNLLQVLAIVALIIFVMGRRLGGVPLLPKRLVLLPAVLVVYGVYQLSRHHVTPVDIALLAVEAVVAVALGLLRGITIRVYEDAGRLWYRYTPWTLVVWVASAAARIGLGIAAHLLGGDLAATASIALMVGATFLGEAAVVGTRALRTGLRFGPDGRITGGFPATVSPGRGLR
jgi:hypothetical protein